MHKFSYRAPRFPVDLPVNLILTGFRATVRCTEICIDGMKVEAPVHLAMNASGTIVISFDNVELQVNVRVARADNTEQALEFIFSSKRDRASLARMIARLTKPK